MIRLISEFIDHLLHASADFGRTPTTLPLITWETAPRDTSASLAISCIVARLREGFSVVFFFGKGSDLVIEQHP